MTLLLDGGKVLQIALSLSLSLSLSILFSSFARDFFYRRVCACVSDVEKEEEEEEEGEDCV